MAQPYTLEKFLKDKINAKLEEKRTKRVQIQSKMPNVNKDLFLKLKDQETSKKKAKTANLVNSSFSFLNWLLMLPNIFPINGSLNEWHFSDLSRKNGHCARVKGDITLW